MTKWCIFPQPQGPQISVRCEIVFTKIAFQEKQNWGSVLTCIAERSVFAEINCEWSSFLDSIVPNVEQVLRTDTPTPDQIQELQTSLASPFSVGGGGGGGAEIEEISAVYWGKPKIKCRECNHSTCRLWKSFIMMVMKIVRKLFLYHTQKKNKKLPVTVLMSRVQASSSVADSAESANQRPRKMSEL